MAFEKQIIEGLCGGDPEAAEEQQEQPEGYEAWLKLHFPGIATKPLGKRHHALWRWFEALEPDKACPPRVDVWPRGGSKSTTGQLGCAYVGTRLTRRFLLYVSETQEQADNHVSAIASMLERLGIKAAVNVEGHSKGWRRNQLRAANGFNVAALGLDTGARGIKLDEFRPDLIIFDDIDGRNDSPKRTGKKETTLTQTILPAGSSGCAVLFLQNLIIEDGIVARMVDGRADYLLDAEIYGPEPAILDLVTIDATLPNGKRYKKIVSGVPTWEGQDLEVCQRQILKDGWTSFKREAQHQVKGADGLFFDTNRFRYCDPEEIPDGLTLCRGWDRAATQGGGDYTVGVLLGADGAGTWYVIDVKREQYASNDVRSLIDRTTQADKAGIVRAADKRKESGAFESEGDELFRFNPGNTPRVWIPQDPGSAGKAQSVRDREDLEGEQLRSGTETGRKSVRAQGLQSEINDGNVILVRGDWNHAFTEEYRKFREDEEHDYDDQIDGGSAAYNDLRKLLRTKKKVDDLKPFRIRLR